MYSLREPWPSSSTYSSTYQNNANRGGGGGNNSVSYIGSPNQSRGRKVERGNGMDRSRSSSNVSTIRFKTSSPIIGRSPSMASVMIDDRDEKKLGNNDDDNNNNNNNVDNNIDGITDTYSTPIDQIRYHPSSSNNRRRSSSAPPRSGGGNNMRNININTNAISNTSESSTNYRQGNDRDSIGKDLNLRWATQSLADFIESKNARIGPTGSSLSNSADFTRQHIPTNHIQDSSTDTKVMTSSSNVGIIPTISHSPIGHRNFSLRKIAQGQGQWQGHGHGETTSSVLFGESPRRESVRDVRSVISNPPYAVNFPEQ